MRDVVVWCGVGKDTKKKHEGMIRGVVVYRGNGKGVAPDKKKNAKLFHEV